MHYFNNTKFATGYSHLLKSENFCSFWSNIFLITRLNIFAELKNFVKLL